jgi:RNase P protein component
MEYIDKVAEETVKEAIRSLGASGKRANSGTVALEAEKALMKKARPRISVTQAQNKVQQAIERLRVRKEIRAPRDKQHDWALVNRKSAAAAGSSGDASGAGASPESE